jgi:Fe-S-cluster-containing hydrogenase component 2
MTTTNFLPAVDDEACVGCGACADVCPMDAIAMVEGEAVVDEALCLGCGLCARACPTDSVTMEAREERVITPINTTHRVVRHAIERGQLQNLIFDRQVLASHRALANVLGAILRLPPIERALASEQVKSRYLKALIQRLGA